MNTNCIENGYFIFTLMPSLHCKLDCPHCYLTREQRRDEYVMPVEKLEDVCIKVREYYMDRLGKSSTKKIICYWYGGEPTDMGIQYFIDSFEMMSRIFNQEDGFVTKQTILSSLVSIKMEDLDTWIKLVKRYCNSEIQTSFDGFMRGKGYVKQWEKRVRYLRSKGVRVSTISVVNHEILKCGAKEIYDYLIDLGINETSWLPFMLNDRNSETGMYDKFAPTMNNYSDFMIRLSSLAKKDGHLLKIGQFFFVASQNSRTSMSNIAGQTLFLLPDGTFCMPDYHANGYQEYLRHFGNIFNESFDDVLKSKERKSWLRKQVMRDQNPECLSCDLAGCCIMEFWKKNKDGDDCFGASKFVRWVLEQKEAADSLSGQINTVLY